MNAFIKINAREDIAVDVQSDLLGLGRLELNGKGSLLSLADQDEGANLVLTGEIGDQDYQGQLTDQISRGAKDIPIIRDALALVGGHLFDLESVSVSTSAAALNDGKLTSVMVKGAAFGKSFTVTLSQPIPASEVNGNLSGAAVAEIKKLRRG